MENILNEVQEVNTQVEDSYTEYVDAESEVTECGSDVVAEVESINTQLSEDVEFGLETVNTLETTQENLDAVDEPNYEAVIIEKDIVSEKEQAYQEQTAVLSPMLEEGDALEQVTENMSEDIAWDNKAYEDWEASISDGVDTEIRDCWLRTRDSDNALMDAVSGENSPRLVSPFSGAWYDTIEQVLKTVDARFYINAVMCMVSDVNDYRECVTTIYDLSDVMQELEATSDEYQALGKQIAEKEMVITNAISDYTRYVNLLDEFNYDINLLPVESSIYLDFANFVDEHDGPESYSQAARTLATEIGNLYELAKDYDYEEIASTVMEMKALQDSIYEKNAALLTKRKELKELSGKISEQQKVVDDAKAALDSAQESYEKALAEYNEQNLAYEDYLATLESLNTQLANARKNLEENEAALEQIQGIAKDIENGIYRKVENDPRYTKYNELIDKYNDAVAKADEARAVYEAAVAKRDTLQEELDRLLAEKNEAEKVEEEVKEELETVEEELITIEQEESAEVTVLPAPEVMVYAAEKPETTQALVVYSEPTSTAVDTGVMGNGVMLVTSLVCVAVMLKRTLTKKLYQER